MPASVVRIVVGVDILNLNLGPGTKSASTTVKFDREAERKMATSMARLSAIVAFTDEFGISPRVPYSEVRNQKVDEVTVVIVTGR